MPSLIGDTLPEDLVYGAQAAELTGVPETVIWQWARRGKIARFPGRYRGAKTMYSLRQIEALAATYKATPQRRPHAAAA
jgi:hypothetical protein